MKERYLLEDVGDNNGFSLITDYDGNDEQAFEVNVKSGEILPVLPLRNMVLFPGVFLPITVGRKSSLKLIRDAEKKHKDIAVVCQRSAHTEDPKLEDLHNVGTVGRIVRVLEMPDQTTTVILQGMKRLRLKDIVDTHPYLKGEVELLEEDLLIDAAQMPGYVSDTEYETTVVLDTNLTPELVEEGFVREIISKIQTMRKEAGFEVMDHIRVYFAQNDKIKTLVDSNNAEIKDEVLANEICFDTIKGYNKEWNINGETVVIGVEKENA